MENESHIPLGGTIILLALFAQNYFLGKKNIYCVKTVMYFIR